MTVTGTPPARALSFAQDRPELAMRKHPELQSTYAVMKVAEDFAKTRIADAGAREQFMSRFRGKLQARLDAGHIVHGPQREVRPARAQADGPVVFRPPEGATAAEVAQMKAYVEGSNEALRQGALSPTGRVATKGALRTEASLAAALERARAAEAGRPYKGHAGHVPDTTWTGNPVPNSWLDVSPRVNSSLGGQAAAYPVGYKPTELILERGRSK